jgi:membrane associated rhomboid family serine protease
MSWADPVLSWTLLTAAFSHMGFMHLAFNMVTVYFISGTLVQ